MKRWWLVNSTIDQPIDPVWAALTKHGRRIFQGYSTTDLRPDGSFTVVLRVPHAPPRVLLMTLGVGVTRADGCRLLPVRWGSDAARAAFPTFDGTVELQPLSPRATQVSLLGSYTPPLGGLGAAIDAVALQRLAHATLDTVMGYLMSGLRIALAQTEWTETTTAEHLTGFMTVADVMTPNPVVIDASLPLRTAALMLFCLEISGAPVVTEEGDLVGVLTERDLLAKEGPPPSGFGRAATRLWAKRDAATAGSACTAPALTTAPDVGLHDAVGEMLRHDVRRLIVVDAGRIAGIVTRHDALAALVRTDEQLAATVTQALVELNEPDVESDVVWGSVRLHGTVSLRSARDAVINRIAGIDGIVDVDAGQLGWSVDDVSVGTSVTA
jgi:CBS domain-containing protein